MRKFKYFRQILACLPGLAIAGMFVFPAAKARGQDDQLSAKQEERSTPAVDALKDALAAPVFDGSTAATTFARKVVALAGIL